MILNIIFNTFVSLVFIILNVWALKSGFEETFISLAIMYGLAVIVGNALFIRFFKSKKKI